MARRYLILFVLVINNCILIGQNKNVETMDKLLELRWKIHGHRYSSNPLVGHQLLYETFGTKYAIDASTGRKYYFSRKEDQQIIKEYTKDSILYFSMNRAGNAVINTYTGEVLYRSKSRIKRPWIKHPRVIGDTLAYFAESDSTFMSFNLLTKSKNWVKKMTGVYDFPVIRNNLIYVFDDEFMYEIDRFSGDEISKTELGKLGANPIIHQNILYLYIIHRGVVALNIETKKTLWEYVNFQSFYKNYKPVTSSEVLYLVSSQLIALSLENGSLRWENQNVGAGESHHLTSTKKYILSYVDIDDQSTLVACDKETGEIIYEGFSQWDDKIGDEIITRTLEDLEYMAFRFGDKMNDNLLYAVDVRGIIYCFEVKE